ncbi:hypothetical protein [Methylomonas sp. YC3]
MRDVGLMGESTFTLWCADAGLISNGSKIDKTEWDFFVEFPFNSELERNPIELHKAAFECKVQVKATDKQERKLPIKLSNLRRLITAQMPAFFVFIEFDGADSAKRAFIVHVDNELISKVLRNLHKIEQSDVENNFNKRTMTIHYGKEHEMSVLNGSCLKGILNNYIGTNLSKYVSNKMTHLKSTGFEDGFAQIHFTVEGEDNLKQLIDVSLGIENDVGLSTFKGTHTRFGIVSKKPFIANTGGRLEMPNLEPNGEVLVSFKESKLSPGVSFKSKYFSSPFNILVPDELKKIRIEGDFFDLALNPYTGSANYSFSLGEGVRLEVKKFRDALKLLNLLNSSGKNIFAELVFEGGGSIEFKVGCTDARFDFSKELKTIECAVKLLSDFEVSEVVDISFSEIYQYEKEICQMASLINASPNLFRVEFNVDGEGFDPNKNVANIFLMTTPIGSHTFGLIIVLTGTVKVLDNERYELLTNNASIEKRLISRRDNSIKNEDLLSEIEIVEERYDADYSVVTMFDKKC